MTSTLVEVAPAGAPPEKGGLGHALLGALLWPRSTFAYLRDSGGRSWLWPVLLVVALAVAARAAAIPIEKAQAAAALAASQAQLYAQGQGNNVKGQVYISGGTAGPFLPGVADPNGNPLLAIGLPAAGVAWDWLFRGAVLLGLAWLLGGRPAPGAMFRMSAWTLLPNGARLLVGADPERVSQVLRNLITNARHHTSPDGSITASASLRDHTVEIAVPTRAAASPPTTCPTYLSGSTEPTRRARAPPAALA